MLIDKFLCHKLINTKQKYLGMVFDSKLTWSSHMAAVCKSMAYLINFHSKSLPREILKMLVESLVFSWLNYALPVWGPAVHQNSFHVSRHRPTPNYWMVFRAFVNSTPHIMRYASVRSIYIYIYIYVLRYFI